MPSHVIGFFALDDNQRVGFSAADPSDIPGPRLHRARRGSVIHFEGLACLPHIGHRLSVGSQYVDVGNTVHLD